MAEVTTTKKKNASKAPAAAKAKAGRKNAAKKAPSKAKPEPKDGFAVIATGGKQYRVTPGQTLLIEKLSDSHKEGDSLVFDKVLLVEGEEGATIGNPFIAGAAVNATLTKIGRAKKVTTIKYKQKSRYYKKYGHRQPYFEIKIDSIK